MGISVSGVFVFEVATIDSFQVSLYPNIDSFQVCLYPNIDSFQVCLYPNIEPLPSTYAVALITNSHYHLHMP